MRLMPVVYIAEVQLAYGVTFCLILLHHFVVAGPTPLPWNAWSRSPC